MTRRNPFAFRIDYQTAIAADEAMIAHFADGGPVDRAAQASAMLRDEIAGDPRIVRPVATALDVMWVAVVCAPEKTASVLALLRVERADALAVIADQVLHARDTSGVPEALCAEALALWGDEPFERESRRDAVNAELLDVRPVGDAARRTMLARARASKARHARRAAA